MTQLRHFLLVFALVFGQLAVNAHAIEHVAGDGDGLPAHVCELCLAAHDLGAALPTLAGLPPVLELLQMPQWIAPPESALGIPPKPRQGAPPFS